VPGIVHKSEYLFGYHHFSAQKIYKTQIFRIRSVKIALSNSPKMGGLNICLLLAAGI
jgi:hypothetical protein